MLCCLVYHEVDDKPGWRGVSAKALDRHCRLIEAFGGVFADPKELDDLVVKQTDAENGQRRFALMFDDALATHANIVAEVLGRYEVHGVFYVPTAKLNGQKRLSATDVARLHRLGHVLGVHGHTHARWDRLSGNALALELNTSREILTDLCGAVPMHCAAPGGFVTKETASVVKQLGFKSLRTMRWGFNEKRDPYAVEVLPMTRDLGEVFIGAAMHRWAQAAVQAAYMAKERVRQFRRWQHCRK